MGNNPPKPNRDSTRNVFERDGYQSTPREGSIKLDSENP